MSDFSKLCDVMSRNADLSDEIRRLRATLAGLPEVLEQAACVVEQYADSDEGGLDSCVRLKDLAEQCRTFAQRINQGKT
jgi:hypothetical protein